MNTSHLTYPGGVSEPGQGSLQVFKDHIWQNSELCNNCFQQIRTIGPVREKRLEVSGTRLLHHGRPMLVEFHEWHERTEHGTQEHTPWDSDRYGTCFCLECGSDGTATGETLPLATLVTYGKRIVRYLNTRTHHRVSGERFGKVLKLLASIDDNSGYDTEKLAVATVAALDESGHPARRSQQSATAD